MRCTGAHERRYEAMNGIYRYGNPFNNCSSDHECNDSVLGHTKQPPKATSYLDSLSCYSLQKIAESITLDGRCWLFR